MTVKIPPITSVKNALHIYYSYSELGNKEIRSLFGNKSPATVSKLKKIVKDEMNKQNILSHGAHRISTPVAYAVWKIDVADLESRLKKIKELKIEVEQ